MGWVTAESGDGARIPGGSVNPMFNSSMSTSTFDDEARQQGNPLFDSRRSPSSVGFTTTDNSQPTVRSERQVSLST